MTLVLSFAALLLVATTMGLSLAHALEFPGKRRLDERTYRAVQSIYYPGFTVGGFLGEVGGMLAVAALFFLRPGGTPTYLLNAAVMGSLVLAHLIYWTLTHPINASWIRNIKPQGASKVFFNLLAKPESDWTHMRDAWEYSHVARSVLHLLGFSALILSVIW